MSQENEDAPKEKKGMPKIIVYVVAGALAAAVFGGGIFIGTKFLGSSANKSGDAKKTEHSASSTSNDEEDEDIPSQKVGVVVPMKEDILFNPKDAPSRFVMVGIGIEVNNAEEKEKVEKELSIPINAALLRKLRSYTLDALQTSSVQDSLPIILKKEIRPIFGEIKLRNIYISKFIIQ